MVAIPFLHLLVVVHDATRLQEMGWAKRPLLLTFLVRGAEGSEQEKICNLKLRVRSNQNNLFYWFFVAARNLQKQEWANLHSQSLGSCS